MEIMEVTVWLIVSFFFSKILLVSMCTIWATIIIIATQFCIYLLRLAKDNF